MLAISTALGFIILMIILLGTDGADVGIADWWGMGRPVSALTFVSDGALSDRPSRLVCHGPLGDQFWCTRSFCGPC